MVEPVASGHNFSSPEVTGEVIATMAEQQLIQVHDYLQTTETESVDRLIEYLKMPSISAHGIGMAEVADVLVDWMNDIGLDTKLMETPGWPMVLGRSPHQEGRPTVLFYGHYDVQPADDLEHWDSPPFDPTIRNGRIYARGAGDNKGQHFAQLLAIEATMKTHGELPCNVIFLLEGEEEVGSPNIAGFADHNRELLKADLVVTSDGPVHENGQAVVLFGVRGVVAFELHARGANQDLHSGNFGNVAPNPIWTLVHLLSTMKNAAGEITIEGLYDDVDELGKLELDTLQSLPVNEDEIKSQLDLAALDLPDRPYYLRLAQPTFTINGITGGYSGEGMKTVLPHEASVKCDIRLVESQSHEDIIEKVKAHVAKHAPNVEVVAHGGMDPSKTPLDSPFAQPLSDAVESGRREKPLAVPALGGSLPDYVWTKILGLPSFVIPYANADEANHAPNENIEVNRFLDGIRTGSAIMNHLGRMEATA